VAEGQREVKYMSSTEMGELVGMKNRIKAFQMAFGKVRNLNMRLDCYEERVLEGLDQYKHLNKILCGSCLPTLWKFC
jgi:hypothetical protein